jgi:hypothetical protein
MIEASIDCSALSRRLEEMEKQIAVFPHDMADELTEWQRVDVHRTTGLNTELKDEVVETIFRQGGRSVSNVKQRVRTLRSKMRQVKTIVRGQAKRPILRPMLFDKLVERMKSLLDEKLGWQ